MIQVPLFCGNCGGIFMSGGRGHTLMSGIAMVGDRLFVRGGSEISGTCPFCSGRGYFPQGIYEVGADALSLLAGPARTVEQWKKLAAVLRRAKREGFTAAEVEAALTKEVPELAGLAQMWSSPERIIGLVTLVFIILTFLAEYGPKAVEYLSGDEREVNCRDIIEQAVEAAAGTPPIQIENRVDVIINSPPPENPAAE